MIDLKPYFITVPRAYTEGTVEVFEQAVQVPGAVKRATLAVTALGVYEAQLNGKKAGDVFLAPGHTYYPHNLHVQQYDVTHLLCAGGNTLRTRTKQKFTARRPLFRGRWSWSMPTGQPPGTPLRMPTCAPCKARMPMRGCTTAKRCLPTAARPL